MENVSKSSVHSIDSCEGPLLTEQCPLLVIVDPWIDEPEEGIHLLIVSPVNGELSHVKRLSHDAITDGGGA